MCNYLMVPRINMIAMCLSSEPLPVDMQSMNDASQGQGMLSENSCCGTEQKGS